MGLLLKGYDLFAVLDSAILSFLNVIVLVRLVLNNDFDGEYIDYVLLSS